MRPRGVVGGDGRGQGVSGETVARPERRPLPPAAQEYVDRKRAERLEAEPNLLLLEERLGVPLDGLVAAAKRDQLRPGREEQAFALVRCGVTILHNGPLAPLDRAYIEDAVRLVERGGITTKDPARKERLLAMLRAALDGDAAQFATALDFAHKPSVRAGVRRHW